MNKQERMKKAKAHYEDITTRLAVETRDSILRTTCYNTTHPRVTIPKRDANVFVYPMDSVGMLFPDANHIDYCVGKTCILNYASYKNPGGFFLGGSSAQEEGLCHESNLYPILLAFDDTHYEWNKRHLNRALYLDTALYTPDVVFERYGKRRVADVLTCAAPNFGTAHRFQNVSMEENEQVVRKRLEYIGKILVQQNVDTFVAGAWGCGVFKQDPSMMVKAITEILFHKYHIPRLIYAIPNEDSPNFKAFLAYFDKENKS